MSKLSSKRSTMLGFQPPAIGDEEIAAVTETLRSGWLTSGPRATELEERMAEYLEAKHVLALASGTAARPPATSKLLPSRSSLPLTNKSTRRPASASSSATVQPANARPLEAILRSGSRPRPRGGRGGTTKEF